MNYYYLISSLPTLQIDDTSLSQEQLEELIALISRNLTSEDRTIHRCLLHASDNQNLLYILFREYHDFEIQAFNRPASIPIELLENYRRAYPALPDYMANYLNDLSGSFASISLREMEHALGRYFHDYLSKLDVTFLNTYYLWRFRLKRVVAELNAKSYPFLHAASEAEEPTFMNVKTLHGLEDFEGISNRLMPLVEANNLEGIERNINEFYWQFADCWQEPFASERVFAYMIKLIRLHRWKGFTSKGASAKEKFERLISDLKVKESSPKMPVV